MTKLTVVFRNFEMALKNYKILCYFFFFAYIVTSNLQQSANKMHTTDHLHSHKYIKTVKLLHVSKLNKFIIRQDIK